MWISQIRVSLSAQPVTQGFNCMDFLAAETIAELKKVEGFIMCWNTHFCLWLRSCSSSLFWVRKRKIIWGNHFHSTFKESQMDTVLSCLKPWWHLFLESDSTSLILWTEIEAKAALSHRSPFVSELSPWQRPHEVSDESKIPDFLLYPW